MALNYKSNVKQVVADLERKEVKIVAAMAQGARAGAELYLGRAKQRFMSGRPGLRSPTGTLRRSWWSKSRVDSRGILVTVGSASKYAAVHEYGSQNVPSHQRTSSKGKTYTVRAHIKTYPKRLRMRSTWRHSGVTLIAHTAARFAIKAGNR